MIIGGALGNVIDRLIHGHVVDFLLFYWKDWYYPAFNVADSFICVGAVLLVLDGLFHKTTQTDRRTNNRQPLRSSEIRTIHMTQKDHHPANPRGFCAGVDRAISIVERALEEFGAPVYVRHEVVHNKFVVDNLREKGAIFIEDLADVPKGAILIYSAHGVPKPYSRKLLNVGSAYSMPPARS